MIVGMNREIKFRTWDFKNNIILPNIVWSIVGIDKVWLIDPKGVLNSTYNGLKIFTQFTGLTDKNGKEIYEGDIISYWPFCAEGYQNTKAKVPELTAFHWFEELELMLTEYPNQCEIEVIGNIYENPELLNE